MYLYITYIFLELSLKNKLIDRQFLKVFSHLVEHLSGCFCKLCEVYGSRIIDNRKC